MDEIESIPLARDISLRFTAKAFVSFHISIIKMYIIPLFERFFAKNVIIYSTPGDNLRFRFGVDEIYTYTSDNIIPDSVSVNLKYISDILVHRGYQVFEYKKNSENDTVENLSLIRIKLPKPEVSNTESSEISTPKSNYTYDEFERVITLVKRGEILNLNTPLTHEEYVKLLHKSIKHGQIQSFRFLLKDEKYSHALNINETFDLLYLNKSDDRMVRLLQILELKKYIRQGDIENVKSITASTKLSEGNIRKLLEYSILYDQIIIFEYLVSISELNSEELEEFHLKISSRLNNDITNFLRCATKEYSAISSEYCSNEFKDLLYEVDNGNSAGIALKMKYSLTEIEYRYILSAAIYLRQFPSIEFLLLTTECSKYNIPFTFNDVKNHIKLEGFLSRLKDIIKKMERNDS